MHDQSGSSAERSSSPRPPTDDKRLRRAQVAEGWAASSDQLHRFEPRRSKIVEQIPAEVLKAQHTFGAERISVVLRR